MKNILLNIFLNLISFKTKLFLSRFLEKYSRIIWESSICTTPDFDSNGESLFIKNLQNPLNRIIDAGANQGRWSATFLKIQPNLKHLVLIEPNNLIINKLKSKFKNDHRVIIKNVALDYRKDSLPFIYESQSDTHAHLNFSSESKSSFESVNTQTIDELLQDLKWPNVDLLKLDLEGFDYYALLGARNSLAQGKIKIIQFEVTRAWEESGSSPCAAIRFLSRFDFDTYLITSSGLKKLNMLEVPHFSLYSNYCACSRYHKNILKC